MENYTKGKWEVIGESIFSTETYTDNSRKTMTSICDMAGKANDLNLANARRIVHCVNNFDAVVEALKELIQDKELLEQDEGITACQCLSGAPDDITSPLPCSYCQAMQALAQVKGE